jgi:MYXO-CTERM domain-containing protein
MVTVNTAGTYYVMTKDGLAAAVVNGSLRTAVGDNGAYGPVGEYPTTTWAHTNYFRDVVFVAGGGGGDEGDDGAGDGGSGDGIDGISCAHSADPASGLPGALAVVLLVWLARRRRGDPGTQRRS